MVDVEGGAPLAHEGPWTEEAYQALPRDRRIELVDGSLLVAPSTGERHAAAVAAVRAAVEAALPEGLEVSGPVALRLCQGRILVPDLVVSARGADSGSDSGASGSGVRDGSVALVVIDVVGSGNGVADRWFKPQLYAGSGIPYALLVDHDDPFAVATMLIGGRYHEYARAGEGEVLRLEEPFGLELEPAALGAASLSADPAPGEFADEPGELADAPGEFADAPGEFADSGAEFAAAPGESADHPGEFADGTHESTVGADEVVDEDREAADRPGDLADRADGSGDGHGPDHGDEQRLGA